MLAAQLATPVRESVPSSSSRHTLLQTTKLWPSGKLTFTIIRGIVGWRFGDFHHARWRSQRFRMLLADARSNETLRVPRINRNSEIVRNKLTMQISSSRWNEYARKALTQLSLVNYVAKKVTISYSTNIITRFHFEILHMKVRSDPIYNINHM